MRGKRLALVFTAPSTRTRASFWSAACALGFDVTHFGPLDLQLSTGETWRDTGMVLAQYVDSIAVRTNGPQWQLEELAEVLPATINALTYEEHPTQAVADACALREHFGRLEGLAIAYLGPVNNTARALAILCSKTSGMTLDLYSPEGSGLDADELSNLNDHLALGAVRQWDCLPDSPSQVDVVYTTRWQSMGENPKAPDWKRLFAPFAVDESTLRKFGGATPAMFMHDLPAVRGLEVTSQVLDGPKSLTSIQARHKRSAAAASLLFANGASADVVK